MQVEDCMQPKVYLGELGPRETEREEKKEDSRGEKDLVREI